MRVYLAYADNHDRHADWDLVGVYATHESATAASRAAQEEAWLRVPEQIREKLPPPCVEEHEVLP